MKPQLYCGLDIHKSFYYGCIIDATGRELRSGRFPAQESSLIQFFSGIANTECIVAIENCPMWRFAYKLLNKLGFSTKLAHSSKTKQIVGQKKTDYYDSKALANLLRTNYLPELYIPDDKISYYRDLTHHLRSLRESKTRCKNKIKGELLKNGIQYPRLIWNKSGKEWLKGLKIPSILSLLHILKAIELEDKKIEKQITKEANKLEETQLLMTVPGIGHYLALIIFSEIGDITRFCNGKSLVMYAGLCPAIHQTGNSSFDTKNSQCNKFLKHAFHTASGRAAMMKKTLFYKAFSRIKNKKNLGTSRRIIARKLALIVWNVLIKKREYKP